MLRKMQPCEPARLAPLPSSPPSFHSPHSSRIKAEILQSTESSSCHWDYQAQLTKRFLNKSFNKGTELSLWEVNFGCKESCAQSWVPCERRGAELQWHPTGIICCQEKGTALGKDTLSSGLLCDSSTDLACSCLVSAKTCPANSAEESIQ